MLELNLENITKLNALVDFFIEEESRYKEEIIKNKINGTRFNF